jgi:transcriptional regulator with GAF, ATPase, and Fis domain
LTDADQDLQCCAVPLIAGNDCLGCLYLDGRADSLSFDASDLVFFRALGSQVATAMDRTRLAEIESRRQEQEKRMLRAELKELRQALQQAKLVYRSPQMESLVATAHRVASTDATVLITGASGTGKELLARTVHELSSRRGQPFVIVDCGAIPTTLIESELFGSEKGAFTGAQARRAGRLAEANYGTVLLDEIGELPLEVQSKLLRFVQEKQLTRVGGTRQQKVDVRILAATNRNLKDEVAAGHFREDLYYRLNVIHLAVPPLRDRPEDILHLANHFLEIFSVQYQKNVRRITPAAASALTRHPWPGNVRELQNRVMQAVILCEGSQLGPEDLGLTPNSAVGATRHSTAEDRANPAIADETPVSEDSSGNMAQPPPPTAVDPGRRTEDWTPRNLDTLFADLRHKLAELVHAADNGLSPSMLPLGRWLDEDLLVAADTLAEGVARRAATTLGLAETTFRRRLQKAKDRIYAGLSPRVADWEDVQPILAQMVRSARNTSQDLIGLAQRALLEEIVARFPDNVRTGSALLAVSSPTYRKRLTELTLPTSAVDPDESDLEMTSAASTGALADSEYALRD